MICDNYTKKLKMSFSNVEVLSKDRGWKMLADVEGRFQVRINNKIFFDEERILVLELALALMKWIEKTESGNIIDFYYESMDFEDKPLLKFTQNDDIWNIYSVWQLFIDRSNLSLEEIISVSQKYISEVSEYLKNNFGFDFLHFLQSEKLND